MNFIFRLHHFDQDLSLAINSLHCGVSDVIWQTFSNREIWFVLYAAVLVFLVLRLGWKRALLWTVAIVLMIAACDQFSNLIKDTVARWRPCNDQYMLSHGLRVLEGRGGKYGFFSAHAANALAFAIGSARAFRSDGSKCRVYTWSIYIWAILVGVSRIFVGKHYFGDVITGFLVALAVGFTFSWLVQRISERVSWFSSR
ncbi:MAG: phosphatase PAP2 family protein [Bacteroidales bacterium]|nr:phosphatase PAP2 family protein [Bacteroidales bacterium]